MKVYDLVRLGAGFLILAGELSAQDIAVDEEALFADTSSLTDSATMAKHPDADIKAGDGKTVGFSGNILSVSQAGVTRAYFDNPDVEHSSLANAVVGDLALDVRMLRGYKAFANLEWIYAPPAPGSTAATADSGATWRVPEMFLDANIAHRAYFRVGKQVLHWGRTFFFNPTDLINVERKPFFRRIGSREGVYGAKAHMPFGTAWNLYGFLDVHGVQRADSLAGALRAERLWGRTEMSLMVWDRGGRDPVYGADVSTRLLGLDVNAELAVHQEFQTRTVSIAGGVPSLGTRREEWAPRASVSLGRSFRIQGIQDRLTLVGEYYYNGPGNTDRRLGLASFLSGPIGTGLTGMDGLSTLAASGFYEPNSYSMHYAGCFATLNRFLRRNLTLTFNTIGNLNQRCALISSGIAYRDLNDFGLSLWVNGFAGPEDTEYTLFRQAMQMQVIAETTF